MHFVYQCATQNIEQMFYKQKCRQKYCKDVIADCLNATSCLYYEYEFAEFK